MSLFRVPGAAGDEPDPGPARCSAKGCRSAATWVLTWNNPRLHTPDRRKAWAACDEHRDHLASFLRSRGFLRDVEPIDDAPAEGRAATGPPPTP